MSFLGGSSTTVNTPAGLTPEERQFIRTQTKLSKQQLANTKSLKPFQRQLIRDAMRGMESDRLYGDELDKLISPQDRAAAEAAEFERAQKLGPIQEQILQMQLKQLKQGGRATPQQIRDIAAATDASILSGSSDIDRGTQEGIGLIADELANSRGLRLTDTPILREATLLANEGEERKGSLVNSLRANQADARLNYPLAVQGLNSQMNMQQQGILQSASQFMADLRQRAFQNRMALTGQASNTGLGLSSVGGQQPNVPHGGTSTASKSPGLAEYGSLFAGIGALAAFSDSRLKDDHGVVGSTPGGAKVHAFRYKWDSNDDPLRLGVMAQEIERDNPKAVLTRGDGIKLVDYSMVR